MIKYSFGASTRSRLWTGFWVAAFVALASLLSFVVSVVDEASLQAAATAPAEARICQMVHDSLLTAEVLVDDLSTATERGKAGDLATMEAMVRDSTEGSSRVFGAGIALDPLWLRGHPAFLQGRSPNQMGQLAIYYTHNAGSAAGPVTIKYDYTDPGLRTSIWYTEAAKHRAPRWVGPYFGQAAQTNFVAYSRPLFDGSRQFMGIAFSVYSLSELRATMARGAADGQAGAILLSGNGTILYHPKVDLMEGEKSMREIASLTNTPSLLAFSDSIDRKSPTGHMAFRSSFTREKTLLSYRRIPDLGWYLVSIVSDRIDQLFCNYQRQLALLLLAFMLLGIWLWSLLTWDRFWITAAGVSGIFVAGMVATVWISVLKYESGICTPASSASPGPDRATEGCSRSALTNSFAASAYTNRCFELDKSMLSIPTGVAIQTINYTSAYSFSISGYLWQKYRNRADTSLLGVEFPENESSNLAVAYNDSLAPGQFVRGWHFTANIRQPFSYRQYPVDKEEFWLRMRPKGLAGGILLEPDFLSYRQSDGLLLGIDQNLVLPKWKILGTNFSYAINHSTTDFGKQGIKNHGNAPELYFSIHVRRNILDAFISHFIPLFVIILMLFAILWVGRKQSIDSKLLGFSSLSGASGCSGLFFIAIFNHISIRNTLGVSEVVYMEYFFFVTYAAILFVSLNAILVGTDSKSWFINHNDNQISRLLYWPMVTGSLFICTFVAFF